MRRMLLKSLMAVAAMLICLSASAIDKVVKSTGLDNEVTSLEELYTSRVLLENSEGNVLCIPTGWDCKVSTVIDAISTNDKGIFYELLPDGDHYLMPIYNVNGDRRRFWAGEAFVNAQPGGNVIFGLGGDNDQKGQDGPNLALWDVTYEAGKGFAFHNVGRNIYLGSDATDARPSEEIVYWKAYTAYHAGYVQEEVFTAYNEATAAARTTETIEALQQAKNDYDQNQDLNAFGDAINAAIDVINACESVNAAYANLDEAGNTIATEVLAKYENKEYANIAELRAAYIPAAKAQTTPGSTMTGAIINPSFEFGTLEGWTSTDGGDVAKNYNFAQRTGDKFVERWTAAPNTLSDGSLLQTLTDMPNGKYTLTAEMHNMEQGNGSAPGTGFYLVANDDKTAVATHGETVTVSTVVTDNTLTIGTKLIECSGNWVCEDNFQLTYNGPVATDEELAPLTAEIANAKLLGVDVTEWEGKTFAASEIDAAVKAIKVAEYNTVIAAYPMNAGTLIPAFDAWEGGMAANKGQHWDGTLTSTYYEQAGDEWGKDSWTNSKTTTVNLPKGKYVIYAAGRNSAGGACSSYIKVNEATQIFPAKGDTGFGIATDGTATFDPSATYANNNVGRGFEYRFIAFEVTADEGEEITLTVGGEAIAAQQWMSICTPVLLTTSDNSAIAKQVLTSDIAAAQAIVDAKAGVGEGLFLIPEEAFNTFAAAVDAAKTANENPEATTEEINTAIAELAAATETYKNSPVNAPAADKQYTLTLFATDGTELFPLSIATGKISIEEVGTPVTFVAKENGTYALSNGTEEIYYSNSANNWDLDATAEGGYAWTITAIADGKYNIIGKNGRFLGTNANDKAAGSKCYGDKKADNGSYIWSISEYVAPVEPTTYAITVTEGIENGVITTDVAEAEEGATVTITATPAEGYKLESISVKNGEEDVEVSDENTFVMPAAPVTISATFVEDAVEPDPNLIEIAQTVDADQNMACTKTESDEYTQYDFAGDISVAFKMLNVDVKDCDYVIIKFAEPTPAGLSASFFNGIENESIPEGVTEWKNVIADNTAVVDGIMPQIALLTIFTGEGKSVKVEGVYKHKVASEPELATVENMTLTVAEDAVIEDEDKTFPVVFGYKAIVDESISPMASMSVTYKVTANGEEILSETFAGIDIAKETQNIWIKNMEYGKTYTVTITSVSVSYFDLETFGDNVAYTKTFAEDELTATFTTNAIPVSIDGINAAAKSNRKVVENGRVVIYKNGVKTMSSGVSIR
ncbi:MAG: hypothetical protein UDK36_09785 [Bacteroidaceae bacterium]|nr:hypothetical protein [Bacteroidaceae bacterium]